MVNSSIPKQVLDETFTVNSNRTGNFHTYQLSMPKYRKPTSFMTNLQFTSNKLVHSNLFSWFWWAYVDDQQFTTGTRKVWFACHKKYFWQQGSYELCKIFLKVLFLKLLHLQWKLDSIKLKSNLRLIHFVILIALIMCKFFRFTDFQENDFHSLFYIHRFI